MPNARVVALAALLIVSACTGQSAANTSPAATPTLHGSTTSSPAVNGSPTPASAAPSAPRPTPTAMEIAIPPSLRCRLPYATNAGNGFITFPGGDWFVDPTGAMHQEKYLGDLFFEVTDTSPTLRGTSVFWSGNSAFDSVINRWLPVRREQVSPDGSAYAYVEEQDNSEGRFFHLHYVTLPDGNDSVIFSGATDGILGWNSDGIILTTTPGEGLGNPLTVVEPPAGRALQIPGTRGFELLVGTKAWTDDGYVMPSHIYREDLSTGTVETWLDFSSQGSLNFLGLDLSGHPIASVQKWTGSPQASPLGPVSLQVFFTPSNSQVVGPGLRGDIGLNDSHGTWLGTTDGLYLLDPQDRLYKVSNLSGNAAGPCT